MEAHLRLHQDDLITAGHDPEEARRMAVERLGDPDEVRRALQRAARERDRRLVGAERADGLRRDVTVAVRRMIRRPGHSALSIAIFAFGIALTTTMFTVVDGVLLRPLPFPDADRLVALYSVPEEGEPFPWVSMGNWYDWARENRTLVSTTIHSQEPVDMTVSGVGEPFVAPAVRVYGPFFETLGIPLVVGAFPDSAAVGTGEALALVSERFWRDDLGGVPLMDRSVSLDGIQHRVVGVVEAEHAHPEGVDLWLPRPSRAQVGMMRNNINFRAIGRLRDDATLERSRADLTAIADGIRSSDPAGVYSWGVDVRPLADDLIGDARPYLLLLMGAVGLVLVIACVNLAALGFARGADRVDEIELRLSLGARRGRIVRQLLSEELTLALVGGTLGVVLAWLGTEVLTGAIEQVVPRGGDVQFDGRVALFGVLAALAAGVGAGLPPALGASASSRSSIAGRVAGRRHDLPGTVLVAGEVALSVLLVTGGILLFLNLSALTSRPLGYEPGELAAVQVSLTGAEYRRDEQSVLRYWDEVGRIAETTPSVESIGFATWAPTTGGGSSFVDVRGDDDPDGGAGYRVVGGRYFESLRLPVLRGRVFDAQDSEESEPVTVVSQAMADEFWPGQDPVGQRVRAPSMEAYAYDGDAPWRTVVGVVGDVRHYGYDADPEATMYVPHAQMLPMALSMTATIRFRGTPTAEGVESLRRAVQAIDPSLAVRASLFDDRLRAGLAERRLIFGLLGLFAVAGLLLASLGVYSVISHSVARRGREMAIRSALGAGRARVAGTVVGGTMIWVGIGTCLGLVAAYGARGSVAGFLVDVQAGDPRAYLAAAVFLALVTLLAAAVPAVRASRVDPLAGLRMD